MAGSRTAKTSLRALAMVLAIAFPARALPSDATAANATMSLDALLIALPAGLALMLGLALLHYRRRALDSTRGMTQLEERLRTEAAARQRAELVSQLRR